METKSTTTTTQGGPPPLPSQEDEEERKNKASTSRDEAPILPPSRFSNDDNGDHDRLLGIEERRDPDGDPPPPIPPIPPIPPRGEERGQEEEEEGEELAITTCCSSSSSLAKPTRRPPQSMQSIGAFAVQCCRCMRWRLVPTKDIYEKIRENILEDPFFCESARLWRPDSTCADPPDITQDGSRVWAIDIPNISRPPPRWDRLLRIRGEGSTKFADVYYVAPSGKRLRSMVEVQKHLLEHPEYISEGVNMSQFSFQTPKPLQENYLRKRPPRLPVKPNDGMRIVCSEPEEVSPLAWAHPAAPSTDLQLGIPGPSSNLSDPSSFGSQMMDQPHKKRKILKTDA